MDINLRGFILRCIGISVKAKARTAFANYKNYVHFSNCISQDKRAVERLEVEKVYHPFIAGPFNKLVSEIMQETGTRINIPPPSVNRTEIVFIGEKEQLAQAVARVKKIYEEKV